ncbi:MAG: hypothetical protein IKX26_07570 [Bacteroidales bacterium]|nr:hypothetical protein [Bacteroidales bacterium]
MKKAVFTLAILAAAGLMIASCGNNSGKKPAQEPAAQAQQAAPAPQPQNAASEAESVKTEDRAWYTVDIPASWETKQYVSEMTLKKGGMELNFKEQAKSDVANWIDNIGNEAEEKLDAISTGDITWNVFKNVQGFKTVYVAQVNDGVVRVGTNLVNQNDPEVIKILETVKGK